MNRPDRKEKKYPRTPKKRCNGAIPAMKRYLVLRFVKKLSMYVTNPDRGEDAVDRMLGGDIGGDVSELASGERVDGNAFLFWFCCDSSKGK